MLPAAPSFQSSLAAREQLVSAALFDATTDAVYLLDPNGKILCWNAAATACYGWLQEEVIGQSVEDLLYGAEQDAYHLACTGLQAQGRWQGEQRQLTRAGNEVLVFSRFSWLNTPSGRCVLVVNTNVTQQKAIESRLFQSQRMESLGALAGGLAHDMGNMLGSVLMLLEGLPTELEPAKQQLHIQQAVDAARKGIDMVEQMLVFASGGAGRQHTLDTGALLADVLSLLQSVLPDAVRLDLRITPGLWSLEGDPVQLQQVLMNLCLNARDAIVEEGVIRIRAHNITLEQPRLLGRQVVPAGHYVLCSIADNGQGISRANLDRIFEPFYSTKEKGTGLGLATALGIVTRHEGFMDVLSTESLGTTFKVYLPALAPACVPQVSNILILDDDPVFRRGLASLLVSMDLSVSEAQDVASARQELRTAAPDLIMCDLRLDDEHGGAFLSWLKAHPVFKTIPVVAISAGPFPLLIQQQADHTLRKPFGVNELKALLLTISHNP
ncbi:MAG: ATP-binding protein [Bacteroidota bacterium]